MVMYCSGKGLERDVLNTSCLHVSKESFKGLYKVFRNVPVPFILRHDELDDCITKDRAPVV